MKSVPNRVFSNRWVRRAAWVTGAVLVYTLAGFLVLPPIVRAVAAKQLSKQLERKVSIQQVRLNPYALSVTIRGLLIADKDGEPFVSWDEVYVNLQIVSFFGHPWVFKEVRTTKPHVRVQVNPDRTLNFSDLLAKFSPATNAPPAPIKPAKPLALRIDELQITQASASLADLTVRTPFKRIVGPLNVTLREFRTDPDNQNPYSFAGTTDAGERFSWSGFFYLDPIRSQGEFSLEEISLPKYAPLYQDLVRFEIQDGTIALKSTYRFALTVTNLEAAVTNTSFTSRNFKLSQPGTNASVIELPELTVNGASVDLESRQAHAESVAATGASLGVSRGRDNSINMVELAKPAATATNAPGGILLLLQSVTNVVNLLLSSTNAWIAGVDNVDVRDCSLSLEDLANAEPVHLRLDQINLTATNLSNLPGTNLSAALSLRWNTNGSFKTGVTAAFAPTTAEIQLAAHRLELAPLNPYLAARVDAFLLGSKLSLDGSIHLAAANDALPEVSFKGSAQLDEFTSVDSLLAEDLVKWGSVRLSGMEAVLNPPSVDIRQIDIDDLVARVVIQTNRTVNLLTVMRWGATNTPPQATAAPETKPAPAKKPGKKGALAAALDSSEPATNALAGLPRVTIGSVVLSNAQVHFLDRSLTPAVNISVQQASGTITGLSTEQLQRADIAFKARVDNVGPVEITGKINPIRADQTNELRITASHVDLTPASPYFGKFAGYRLAQGQLGLDLAYHLQGRNLKAENVLTLDRFTFGDKVNSPDATKLPVRLGVALLKDRDGKIKLDVPMDGSLDDPQFRIGKVVVRVIENLLVKVATSPFSLLGGLFGGKGEDLRFQEFPAGSAELAGASKEKLDAMVKALYERPALQLVIEGSVNPGPDREALRHQALHTRLQALKWKSLKTSEKAATSPGQVVFTPDEHAKWIKRLYREAVAQGEIRVAPAESVEPATGLAATNAALPAVPAAIVQPLKPVAQAAERGATALMQPQKPAKPPVSMAMAATPPATGPSQPVPAPPATESERMEQALLETMQVSEADLQGLAAERAKTVRDYLAQSGKVEPERLFLAEKQGEGLKTEGSRVYLQLQ